MQRAMRASVLSALFVFGLFHTSVQGFTLKRGAQNPVSYVVELLKALEQQVTEEGKVEEDMYEKYVCWATSIINDKTASNEQANQRIGELETYISDIENGRVEFTSERVDLEKEIEQLTGDIEVATETRDRERSDFNDAKDEMDKGIAALKKAINVLKEATTEGGKKESLLLLRNELHESLGTRAKETASLNHAVTLGERFLTRADALFLRRVLTGDVPERASWKKLNRKATFKLGYKARSGKIQEVLANLLSTFESNLKDAQQKENEADATFEKLMEAKGEQRDAATEALTKMEKEKGAAAMSKSEAQEEVDDLTEQVENDEKYIQQVRDSLKEKKAEWGERQRIRSAELEAISKAIEILHNDDSRDLFKRSFASHGMMFLQVARTSSRLSAQKSVLSALQKVARVSSDDRLLSIANQVAKSGNHFDKVIAAIDDMIAVLKHEEVEDLKTKEDCESDRASNTRKAAKSSRTIDELTDTMTSLQAKIEELSKQIETAQAEVAKLEEEMAAAKKVRDEEHAEYLTNKADDDEALKQVKEATEVMQNFYGDLKDGKVFMQESGPAGKAPPPPPKTWDDPNYGGKTGESNGIIEILKMVQEDISRDIRKANEEEEKASQLYNETKDENNAEKKTLNGLITSLNSTRAENAGDLKEAKESRISEKRSLDGHLKSIENAEPGCNFFVINYHVRRSNRHIEIDGLVKAKAILQGAKFDALDENRELKPGDAFLQRRGI